VQRVFARLERKRALAALPTRSFVAVADGGEEGVPEACVICMDEYASGDSLKRLPCLHEFHAKCVDSWLALGLTRDRDRDLGCPICRSKLVKFGK